MKAVSPSTYDTITNDYHNEVATVVHAEWLQNKFYRTVVDNTPSEDTDGYDIELFPIESITKANRPTSGIARAVVGQSSVASTYYDAPPAVRYYTISPDSQYKYWQSPQPSVAGTFNISDCAPHVLYVEEDDVPLTEPEISVFYLPSSGAAAVSPSYNNLWDNTGSADSIAMSTTPANTANVAKGVNETVSGPVDVLIRQYVGPNSLVAGVKEGSFRLSIIAEESNSDAQMFLNAVIKIVSSDGTVERGVLWAGQATHTSSSVSSDLNYEFPQTPTRLSRLLWGTFTPVTAQDGDRIVLELGYSDDNPNTTGRTGTLHFGDETADTNLPFVVDTGSSTTNRPFFEVTFTPTGDTYVPRTVKANKIHFTVERSYAYPTDYDVQVKATSAGSWTTVASDIAIPSNGKVELWWNGSAWTTNKVVSDEAVLDLHGVRLVINTMNKVAYFNLIELGLALELDLTEDVVSWDDNFNMGEVDFISPLGTISSNNGSVVLFNDHDRYTGDNPASILNGILDKGVIIRCWMKYGNELVQEFEMFSETWEEDESQVTVSIVDGSKFFMDVKPRPVLYRNVPVQEAVWRICDIIGFNNYEVTAIDLEPHSVIDIFWTDGEKTAWELFGELSRATQTAIYFDSFGVLQVRTRDAAWNDQQASQYNFIRDSIPGGQPANIATLREDSVYEANKVTVNWKPANFSEQIDNVIPFEVVWEPEGTVLLRSTPLALDLLADDTEMHLPNKPGKSWPWKGICQIEGEWISFEGKWYVYYNESSVRQEGWVNDYESQKRIDEKTPVLLRHLNKYTGKLKITERGLFNTEAVDHLVDIDTRWTKTRRKNYSTNSSPCPGIKLNKNDSSLTIAGNKTLDMDDYTYLHLGNAIDQGYYYLGSRFKIDKGTFGDKVGGIFFNADDGIGSGYFLEVMATARMNGKVRNTRNEVIFYSMKSDGTKKQYGGKTITMKDKSKNHMGDATTKTDVGAQMAVPLGSYIDFDIWFEEKANGDHYIQVWARGSLLFDATVPNASGWKHSRISRFGMFARGHSSVTFDYIYGINNLGVDPIDGESYFDRIEGGYYGNQVYDWTYETRTVRRKIRGKWTKVKQKYQQRFYEDFGPMVHEIREFNIKFDSETPVLESKLYFSNRSQVVCPEYTGDISGAKFLLANIDRRDAVVNGDDEVTAGGNGTINHKLFVYGRPVIQKDEQKIERTDEWAVRRRGVIDTEYDSKWIQNESEATRFADWLTSHWTRSDAVLEIEVFGNPMIELADVVHVTWKDIDNDFYVVGVENQFDAGLNTRLRLRKVS